MGLAFAGMLMASCTDGGGRLSGGAHAAGDYGGIAGFVPAEERGNYLLYGRE